MLVSLRTAHTVSVSYYQFYTGYACILAERSKPNTKKGRIKNSKRKIVWGKIGENWLLSVGEKLAF